MTKEQENCQMTSGEKVVVSVIEKDGVRITTYKDGSQHFESIKEKKPIVEDTRSWWQKLKDWWNDAPVKPYVKVRDLADPFGDRKENIDDIDAGSDGKNGVEIGIK